MGRREAKSSGGGSIAASHLARIERELKLLDPAVVRAIKDKQQKRKALNYTEKRVQKRLEALHRARFFWEEASAVSAVAWESMAGMTAKRAKSLSIAAGLPHAGTSVDLPAWVRAVHDYLDRQSTRPAAKVDENQAPQEGSIAEAKHKVVRERARLFELERQAKERELLPRKDVHSAHASIGARLRQMGVDLASRFGEDAHEIVTEAILDVQSMTDRMFAEGGEGPVVEAEGDED